MSDEINLESNDRWGQWIAHGQISSRARVRITGVLCFLLSQVSQQGAKRFVAIAF